MSLVNLVGQGLWVPSSMWGGYSANNTNTTTDTALIDADAKEYQIIGDVFTDDGASHVFGNSGAALDWLPGAITFNAVSTVRLGIKQASSISTTVGGPARATAGLSAFDVYKDLVAGVDSLTAATARSDAMATLLGSAITIAQGDQVAICYYLTKSSGTSSVTIRQTVPNLAPQYPGYTLITSSASSFVAQTHLNCVMLKFDDGHYGWIFPTMPFSTANAASGTIGNTNIQGNIIQVPFPCKVNAIAAVVNPSTNAANFALDMYSTPLGTPSQVVTVACDANQMAVSGTSRFVLKMLASPPTLSANTDYAFGVRQTTATAVTTVQQDVFATGHWAAEGNGAECYAANSTAGATFSKQNSGLRRYHVWALISALDAGGGGSGMLYIPNLEGV